MANNTEKATNKIIKCYGCNTKFEDTKFNLEKYGTAERLYCNECIDKLIQNDNKKL